MTTLELLDYYAKLLILQYVGLPRAYATIKTTVKPIIMPQTSTQLVSMSVAPTTGTFTLVYKGNATAAINWNDNAATIQTKLRAVSGLASVTVSGLIAAGFTVSFAGVTGVADLLTVGANSLFASAIAVSISITETDQTLPLAVQSAFDPTTAVGAQLDTIGKYQGVVRSGSGLTGQPITLSDADFRSLIQFAIIRNSAGSSLYTIDQLFHQLFPDEIYVFDLANMHMSYFVNSSVGSQDLVQMLIVQNLLPKPMGVQLATVIYAPTIKFFGMLNASLVVAYAAQYGITINQAALALQTGNNIWQFNSVASPIVGQWLSASEGVF